MGRLLLKFESKDDVSYFRLNVIEGELSDIERENLQNELNERYRSFLSGDGHGEFSPKTYLPSCNVKNPIFSVKIDDSVAGRRNPAIILELTLPDIASHAQKFTLVNKSTDPSVTRNDWLKDFFGELQTILNKHEFAEVSFEKANLQTAIDELRETLPKSADLSPIVALLLLGGYLELSRRIWSDIDSDRSSCYGLALRPIEGLFLSNIVQDETETTEMLPPKPLLSIVYDSAWYRFLRNKILLGKRSSQSS